MSVNATAGNNEVEMVPVNKGEEEPLLPQEPQPTRGWGRVFQDWSQFIVAPVALWSIGSLFFNFLKSVPDHYNGAKDTAMAVALVVALIRLGYLKPRKDFENEVAFFGTRVKLLTQESLKLSERINSLNETKELIREQVKAAKASVAGLGQVLREEEQNFENIAARFKTSVESMRELFELYQSFNQGLEEFRGEISQFRKIRAQIAKDVKKFSGEVVELDENESELSSEVRELAGKVVALKENRDLVHRDRLHRAKRCLRRQFRGYILLEMSQWHHGSPPAGHILLPRDGRDMPAFSLPTTASQ